MHNEKCNVYIKLLYGNVLENWHFTGRIRYEKYSTGRVDIFFEVGYTTKEKIGRSFWLGKQQVKKVNCTKWFSKKCFVYQEKPVKTIVDCS